MIMPRLQNMIMRAILETTAYIRTEPIELIFAGTKEGSPLRDLAVHSFLWHYGLSSQYRRGHYTKQDVDHLGAIPGFLVEMLEVLRKSQCGKSPCSCAGSRLNCYFIDRVNVDERYLVSED